LLTYLARKVYKTERSRAKIYETQA